MVHGMTGRVKAAHYTDVAVYHLQGDLDSSAAELRDGLAESLNQRSVLFDLTGVDRLDSAGLSELLGVIRAIHEAGGSIAIASARPKIIQGLRAAGLDRLVYLAESPLEAVGWLNREREGHAS